MISSRVRALTWLAASAFTACTSSSHSPQVSEARHEEHVATGGTIALRVDDAAIPASLVESVAREQHCSAIEAEKKLEDDALLAREARARGLETRAAVALDLRRARASFLALHDREEANARGPITDDEIEALAKAAWRTFELPEQISVVHALVQRPKPDPKKPAPPDAEARARAIATAMLNAVHDAKDDDDFTARAKAVPHEGFDVVVQSVPRFIADDRFVDSDDKIDPTFARASFALLAPGDTSGIVETTFGWHVIRLSKRYPAKFATMDEKRAALHDKVLPARAQKTYEETIMALRKAAQPSFTPIADEAMRAASELFP